MAGMTRRLGPKAAMASGRRLALLATVAAGLLLAGCDMPPAAKPEANASLQAAQLQAAKQAEASYNYADAVSIYQGLHARNRVEAVRVADERGWL